MLIHNLCGLCELSVKLICPERRPMCEHIFNYQMCDICYVLHVYIYNNYMEYKLKWPRIIIIGNMYTICIKNMYNIYKNHVQTVY